MADTKPKSIAEELREQVEARTAPEDGTVVLIRVVADLTLPKKDQRAYAYVALWVEEKNKWVLSGGGSLVEREYNHVNFLSMLAMAKVIEAKTAIKFDTFKP